MTDVALPERSHETVSAPESCDKSRLSATSVAQISSCSRIRQAKALPFPITLIRGSAEALPIADRSIDAVVTTWTLCSIPDVARALQEARRVLKPNGGLFFVEHGLAPDPKVEQWQHTLTPLWQRVAGGCHLERDMGNLIRTAGFEIDTRSSGYMPGPRVFTYMTKGRGRLLA